MKDALRRVLELCGRGKLRLKHHEALAPVEANRIQEEEASCRRRAALLFNMIEPNDLARSG